jgi:hypothetical protein
MNTEQIPLNFRRIPSRLHGATSQRTALFILVAVETRHLIHRKISCDNGFLLKDAGKYRLKVKGQGRRMFLRLTVVDKETEIHPVKYITVNYRLKRKLH